ncbi:uncharacterized protein METZ01_LOCUS463415, partial [marine metagenome]
SAMSPQHMNYCTTHKKMNYLNYLNYLNYSMIIRVVQVFQEIRVLQTPLGGSNEQV